MRAAVLVFCVLVLSGCGFRPLYTADPEGPQVRQQLSEIALPEIPGRLGQLVHNSLSEKLTPTGEPSTAEYRLAVRVIEERDDVGLRQDEAVTRANYRLRAKFRLIESASDVVLVEGTAWSGTAFDVVQSDFATIVAEDEARERLAEEIAEEIRTRLAIYFAR